MEGAAWIPQLLKEEHLGTRVHTSRARVRKLLFEDVEDGFLIADLTRTEIPTLIDVTADGGDVGALVRALTT